MELKERTRNYLNNNNTIAKTRKPYGYRYDFIGFQAYLGKLAIAFQ